MRKNETENQKNMRKRKEKLAEERDREAAEDDKEKSQKKEPPNKKGTILAASPHRKEPAKMGPSITGLVQCAKKVLVCSHD